MAVLYVDDDETICWLTAREWNKAFPEVQLHAVRTPEEAMAWAEEHREEFLAAVLDWRLGAITAEQLIKDLRLRWPGLCVIATSAALESQQIDAALRAGADEFLVKDLSAPVFVREIAAQIEAIQDRRRGPQS